MFNSSTRPRLGLALGAGAARGWAHIGVIEALEEAGIVPEVVAGCSIGALVGAAYVNGRLDDLKQWVTSLSRWDVARFFELKWSLNGVADSARLRDALIHHVADEQTAIETLEKRFASVATNLMNGQEIWLQHGSLLEAVWASIALPGLFPPWHRHGEWLVDGGMVNPVPVSLCRVLRADVVIAVGLNEGLLRRRQVGLWSPSAAEEVTQSDSTSLLDTLSRTLRERAALLFPQPAEVDRPAMPGLFETLAISLNIMQERIFRSRMAGDPPEVVMTPWLGEIGILEFYRASEAIEIGRACVARMLPELRETLAGFGHPS
ncbi:MAG TPA: patatin-like phospholipase RssA [Pseudomonadales bacterium]|jgi:NTE family protein|nr:patatin-like phospholipase RssA [Pseudomonadales bacterium]HMW83015.1 patatin-like phospholipase RssA [Pseudomonadales bacterium]HMZ91461.1 patatin-like phospholipase RssA [Pseudomonadales bacterium]HNC76461.1 patatin-like phospholipase RssA [Pseudomonadales bacterium]HND27068.1 patatin-like phospholipase RssA [Pseudomonadales bacterium]